MKKFIVAVALLMVFATPAFAAKKNYHYSHPKSSHPHSSHPKSHHPYGKHPKSHHA